MYNNGSSNHIHHVIKLPICAGNFVSTNKSCSSSVIDQKFHGRQIRVDFSISNKNYPEVSKRLGIFGLSYSTTEQELKDEFSRFGRLERAQVVRDGLTGCSKGYAFVDYESVEDAKAAKEAMCDQEIDGRRIRVDFSITKRSHTPTPGVYMGRPT